MCSVSNKLLLFLFIGDNALFSHCFRKFGAKGSRLTGAGWGGCTVSLVPADMLSSFLASVHEAYYQGNTSRLAQEKHSLFATKPGGGALVFREV
jgi:N-acetylgalactosamine kinase